MSNNSETPKNEPSTDPVTEEVSEAIDAEFEPTEDITPGAAQTDNASGKSGVGMTTVVTASVVAALAGTAGGVIATGSSGVDTARFAPVEIQTDITDIQKSQETLAESVDRAWKSISELEALSDGRQEQIELAISNRELSETTLREDFEALNQQLASLLGPMPETLLAPRTAGTESVEQETPSEAGSNEPVTDDADNENNSSTEPEESQENVPPLVRLTQRIAYLEERLSQSDASPETSQDLKRALQDVAVRVEELEKADLQLVRASENRAESISALQTGLFNATTALGDLEDQFVSSSTQSNDDAIAELRAEIADLKTIEPDRSNETATIIDTTMVEETESVTETAPSPNGSDTPEPTSTEATPDLGNASLALARLENDASTGEPFKDAFAALQLALPGNETLETLEPLSVSGVPTLETLNQSLSDLDEQVRKDISSSQTNDGWGWARNAFEGVVTIRRSDDHSDDQLKALESIQTALSNEDMLQAINAIKDIPEAASEPFNGLLEDLEKHKSFHEGLTSIRTFLLDKSQPE